jgi:hypothetical protein
MTMLLESALATGVVSLAAVVGVLWKRVSKSFKSVEDRLDQCEQDRAQLWKKLTER